MTEYPHQPYPPQPYPPRPAGTNTMAILSLVFAFVFSPLGIVFGHIARGQIRRTGEDGAGLALAGLVLSYLFVALAVVSILFFVLFAAGAAGVGIATSS